MALKASSVSKVMNSTTVDSERETVGAPVLGGRLEQRGGETNRHDLI